MDGESSRNGDHKEENNRFHGPRFSVTFGVAVAVSAVSLGW
jgi:hypothetical protein